LELARWIQSKIDWKAEAKWFLEAGLTLGDLLDNTPHELFAVFFKVADANTGRDGRFDKVDELARFNQRRSEKGLMPIVPSWFWKQEGQ
jgi:hypothetical protein